MYDYSRQIESFRKSKVRLPKRLLDILYGHRGANRDRLIGRLSGYLPKTRIGVSNFKPQGSVAVGTVIQTKFSDEEYDIDDGLVIPRSQLVDEYGAPLPAGEVRKAVCDALADDRFKKQPEILTNCVRVFYADEDVYKHHVDFPVYRKWSNEAGETVRELAGEDRWLESNPTQVNTWFEGVIRDRNQVIEGWGSQCRQLIQLLKRFCRSREQWLDLLPNGMKLTMLVVEKQPPHDQRIDRAFRTLLVQLQNRLEIDKVVLNLAHPDRPPITRTLEDENICALLDKIKEATSMLEHLDHPEAQTQAATRAIWEWIFQTDGYFAALDDTAANAAVRDAASSLPSRVPWCERPPWIMTREAAVEITGLWRSSSSGGDGWRPFDGKGSPLAKSCSLRFKASTTARTPFRVFWQVVNTGKEAAAVDCLRGEIIESRSVGKGGLDSQTALHEESTLYRGVHWVECFIVRGRFCAARSGRFLVVVE